MKKILSLLIIAATTSLWGDNFIGEYVGTVNAEKGFYYMNPQLALQVYKEGDTYTLTFYQDLWRRANKVVSFQAKEEKGVINFEKQGQFKFTGKVDGKKVEGTLFDQKVQLKVDFSLPKLDRKSPTLGMAAPKKAIVLFDGTNFNQWHSATNAPIQWKIVGTGKDAYAEVSKPKGFKGKGDIFANKKISGDFKLHLEFFLPDEMKKELGQGRTNSGVFIGPFEIQILDSFGSEGLWNECGALYKFMPPKVNASLPPLTWQTYDIEYEAAEYKNGKMVEFPKISVKHNGIQIHKDLVLTEPTGHKGRERDLNEKLQQGPVEIQLQDHGNPVRFRNIWVELDD